MKRIFLINKCKHQQTEDSLFSKEEGMSRADRWDRRCGGGDPVGGARLATVVWSLGYISQCNQLNRHRMANRVTIVIEVVLVVLAVFCKLCFESQFIPKNPPNPSLIVTFASSDGWRKSCAHGRRRRQRAQMTRRATRCFRF
jgi:hypothetical protein